MKMNKVLYTALVVLVTAWSVFFIANFYYNKSGGTNSGITQITDGDQTIVQEVVEREVVTQESQRIEAIEKVSPAIVGVVNFANNRTQGEGSGIIYKIDKNNAYMSINAGAGGLEATDWAEMLLRMYKRYFDHNGFS